MIDVHDSDIFFTCIHYFGTHISQATRDAMAIGKYYLHFNDSVYDLHDLPYNWDHWLRGIRMEDRVKWERFSIYNPKTKWHPNYHYLGTRVGSGNELDICENHPANTWFIGFSKNTG